MFLSFVFELRKGRYRNNGLQYRPKRLLSPSKKETIGYMIFMLRKAVWHFKRHNIHDSTYIGKDTIISGKKYHTIHTTYGEYVGSPPNIPKTYYLRDSSEFLLAPLGYKWFSTKMEDVKIHEKLVLDQQGIKINHSITMKNAPDIDVNGTLFPCLHADHLYTISRLLSKVNSEINYYNYGSTWYARGVGPVKKVLIGYTNNSPNSPREEKRLVRYFVKK